MDSQVAKHETLQNKFRPKLEKRHSQEEIYKGLNISGDTKLTLSWTISKEQHKPIM